MNKKTEKIIFSFVGIALVILIAVLVNFISSKVFKRIDLTENKIYTLSEASKRIISKLKNPVKIKFYFSKNNPQMPVYLKTYAKRVEDLLDEYVQAGHGNIILEKFDPEPDSDAEDAAVMDGVDGQLVNMNSKVYFGLAVSCIDRTVAIPVLSPDKESLLEYEITKDIASVYNPEKIVVGIMSALPVMGSAPTMQGMAPGPMTPPWLSVKYLKQNYDVKNVSKDTAKIDDDIKVLILIHPAGISKKTQFAIDQFILRGGKLIAYLDPMSFVAENSQKQRVIRPDEKSSNLPELLKAWGLKFDSENVVVDAQFGYKPPNQKEYLSIVEVTKDGLNRKDVSTSGLEKLTMGFAGAFSGTPVEGLKETVLVESSDKSGTIPAAFAENPEYIFKHFTPENKKYKLAVKLTGKFKTAFKDGAPGASKDKKSDFLKESKEETAVILVGDSDLLYDNFCVSVRNILGRKIMIPVNDNINFSQNTVDFMGGDTDLISIRCRPVVSRPFTLVKSMEAKAEEKFKAKIQETEKDLVEIQRRLNELQKRKKSANQRFILSPEQKEELVKFKTKQVKIKKELKQLRKALRKDIDSLESNLKWFNIILMPTIIIIIGIIVAVLRKRKGGAK